jgi:lipopolysaccharide heptosyltransferase I
METYHNILIIKPSALGDIVHALPALASLRASFPQAKISWLVRSGFEPLLHCVPGIDEYIPFDRNQMNGWWYRPSGWKTLRLFLESLRSRHFDLIVDFQGLLRTAFFAWYTRCQKRYGMSSAREGAVLFYSHKTSMTPDTVHLIDYYNRIIRDIGGKTLHTDCTITPPDSAVASMREKLTANGFHNPYAVLVPGSAHHSKCWPTLKFANITRQIAGHLKFQIVGAGTASEHSLVEQIRQQTSVPVLNLAGQTNIQELIALLKNAHLVISNDTGPGHIAAALKVPTVLIFGHTNPLRVGLYKKADYAAAIDPTQRGWAIENHSPAYDITKVSEQLVWEKCNQVLEQSAEKQ